MKDLSTNQIILVDRDDAGVVGNSYSRQPVLSENGSVVAFLSGASNLALGDRNGYNDVFVFDFEDSTLTRVSNVSVGVTGNDSVLQTSISANGRWVAFSSTATNLISGDTNDASDVFVRDMQEGITILASATKSGTQANGDSAEPAISADGRFVAFTSYATNLVDGDDYLWSYHQQVYVKDLQTGTVVLASSDSNGSPGQGYSYQPSISADGRFVAFASGANNLVSDDDNGYFDVFVKDLHTGSVIRASLDDNGNQANNYSFEPSISADGTSVAFTSYANNLVEDDTNATSDIFLKNLVNGAILRLSTNMLGSQGNSTSDYPAISADGRYVAFRSFASNLIANDSNDVDDVFVKNIETGEIILASAADDGQQGHVWGYYSNSVSAPTISADGRYVGFGSNRYGLVPDNLYYYSNHYYVKDLKTSSIMLIDRDAAGHPPQYSNYISDFRTIAMAANGNTVAFISDSRELVPLDLNERSDVFVWNNEETNEPPIANNDYRSTTDQESITGNVLDNDSDPNGDQLLVVSPGYYYGSLGWLYLSADGTYYYQPNINSSGTEAFSYTITDGRLGNATATLTIEVTDVTAPAISKLNIHYGSGQTIDVSSWGSRSLPWFNISSLSVTFSEHVAIGKNDLTITGVNVANYTIINFSYNPTTFTATWSLAAPINTDRIQLNFSNIADSSNNHLWSYDTTRHLNVLPGDANGDGIVNIADQVFARNIMNKPNWYWPYDVAAADVNGDGTVTAQDIILIRSRNNTRLPN